jgi:glycosyltransferase involved in cell wall biosynthesis
MGAWLRLRGKFDAVFVFEVSPITVGIPAIVAGRRFNAPILFWVLDLWPESLTAAGGVRSPRVLRAVDRMVKWIYRNCSRVLVQSRAFVPEIAHHGVPDSRILYFPSWGESLFQPLQQADTALLPPLPKGFKVLFAGNIGEAQDFPAVLNAAELVRERTDIQWLIVGDGRMAAWAKEEVLQRGLSQVHFLGRYPLETMPHFYAAADVLLLPLKREPIFALTIPGKLQSYLASARPILAMLDGEGARIVQESSAGLACPAGDAEGLANQVLKLAAMPDAERRAMGLNGRQYYETNFDRTRLFDQLETWLENAIQERKHSK